MNTSVRHVISAFPFSLSTLTAGSNLQETNTLLTLHSIPAFTALSSGRLNTLLHGYSCLTVLLICGVELGRTELHSFFLPNRTNP